MLKKIIYTGLVGLLIASSINFSVAKGYKDLTAIQPTQDVSKVEVIEFFWYGCPHCYKLEPYMKKWLKDLPKNVDFIRQPAVFNAQWGRHAKAYFTAEYLGVVDKVHADFFHAIQIKNKTLENESDLASFFLAHGVNKASFTAAFNSFNVDSNMRKAKTMGPKYGITGVPAIIINGKYLVSASTAGSNEKMITVINELIAQESLEK
jgi:thiol:disulfide interchange protein DsbA